MDSLRAAICCTLILTSCGCGQKPATPSGKSRPSLTVSIPNPTTNDNGQKIELARLHQPFAEAVLQDCASNQQPPPDRTMTGQSTAKLRMDVQKAWDTIKFIDGQGKPIVYLATINTDFGSFRVQLKPEVAPNHVRNFVALAKVGYYNGLTFEHLIQQESDEGPESNLEMIQGGCPLGTGDPGISHLGYWLRPEVDETVLHQPGALGAFHDEDPDTAACRFYITLTKAPAMDGNYTVFGQVVEGLDVVRTISKLPKVAGTFQPEKPAVIRAIIIETQESR